MKKVVFILNLVLLLVLFSVPAFAQTTDDIVVAIDSVKVDFNEDSGFPFVDENYRTLVPFRKALETYGATVDWNEESRVAIAVKGDIKVEVPIGQNYIIINGQQASTDTAAKIVNGRPYLPIRAVIEAFGSQVEWDQDLKTVVITTVPVDAKGIFMEANEKSYGWKNCDADILMNMSMPIKDDAGSTTVMDMKMKMKMTMFMAPSLKAKVEADMIINMMGQEISQPIMNMYMTADDKALVQYMGINDGTGNLTWMKVVTEDEMLAALLKNDSETMKANKELTEKYIKDVRYLGKYPDELGNSLLKLKFTLSGDIYKEVLGQYMEEMPVDNEEDQMVADVLKAFADGIFGDLTYVVYVDEATKECVKYEMDLGNIISSMLSNMSGLLGDIPNDELEMLKQLKANMTMRMFNINKAVDFEIPAEALNAPEMTEALQIQ